MRREGRKKAAAERGSNLGGGGGGRFVGVGRLIAVAISVGSPAGCWMEGSLAACTVNWLWNVDADRAGVPPKATAG